jgi:hypothetical protein
LKTFPPSRNSTPSNFEITKSHLIILNDTGRELWRYKTDMDLDTTQYHIENNMSSKSRKHINLFIKNLDKDEDPFIIFSTHHIDNLNEGLLCFNKKGKLIWRFKAGKSIQYNNQKISSDFDIGLVRVEDINNDGLNEIVMIARHKIYFPSRISVLNNKGELIGEYWNSGHIECIEFLDLDNDGFKEIILGGLNNNYLKACLVVLDPRNINGSSPQEKGTRYYSEELSPGTEKYYILIPRNEIGRLFLYDIIDAIDLYDNKRIQVSTSKSKVFYEFDNRLNPSFVLCGDQFNYIYKNFNQQGKITTPLRSLKENIFKSEILYWDGNDWAGESTMTEFWKKRYH